MVSKASEDLAGTGQAREHDQLVAREVQRDVLEVVLTGAMDDEPLGAHTGASVEASADMPSAYPSRHGPGPARDPCLPETSRRSTDGAAGARRSARVSDLSGPRRLPRRNAGSRATGARLDAPRRPRARSRRICLAPSGRLRAGGRSPPGRTTTPSPQWSPDGTDADASVSDRAAAGVFQLYCARDRRARRGPAARRRATGVVEHHAWSPDGSTILMVVAGTSRRTGRRAGLRHAGRSRPRRGSGAAMAPRGGVLRRRR